MDNISPEEINQFQQFFERFRASQHTAATNPEAPPPMPASTSSSTTTTLANTTGLTSLAQAVTTARNGLPAPALHQQSPSYGAVSYMASNTTQLQGPSSEQQALSTLDPSHSLRSHVPPINPYQSLRHASTSGPPLMADQIEALGSVPLFRGGLPANVPNPARPMGTGYTPFLGFQQLTGQVNQTRLAAAAANLPRRPLPSRHAASASSQPQSRRNRGRASHPLPTHREGSQLSDCLLPATGQGEPTHARLLVKVLPSHVVHSDL